MKELQQTERPADRAPAGFVEEIRNALSGLWSLVVGLSVTGNQFYRRTITVHYPRRTVDNLSTFRGPTELIPSDKDPMTSKCILCGMCAQSCPSGCIEIESHQEEEAEAEEPKAQAPAEAGSDPEKKAPPKKKKKIKVMDRYCLDFSLCSLCGQCVQVCPVDALRFSTDVYLAGYSRSDSKFELLAKMRAQAPASAGRQSRPEGK